MKELLSAVKTYFDNNSGSDFYTGLSGRLYHKRAPQGAAFPYCVFFLIDDVPQYWFADEEAEEALLQFSIFSDSNSATEVLNLYDYLKTLFDGCALTVSGYQHVSFDRDWMRYVEDPQDTTWQCDVHYRVLIKKS